MNSVIQTEHLSKQFNGTTAVADLNLDVPAGAIFALLGPNGAGKTTTIRLLNGVLTPSEGSITILGRHIPEASAFIRGRCGVQTDTNLYDKLSARDNLETWGRFFGLAEGKLPRRVNVLLEMFDLTHRQDDLVGEFSKGMRQKLSIARALIHDPEILFLDEPTAGLDPEAAYDILKYLKQFVSDQMKTVFLCSHRLEEVEELCDSVSILSGGSIIAGGSLTDLIQQMVSDYTVLIQIDSSQSIAQQVLTNQAVPYEQREAGVEVHLQHRTEVPDLIHALSDAGADIYAVTPVIPTLKDVYLSMIPGESDAVHAD